MATSRRGNKKKPSDEFGGQKLAGALLLEALRARASDVHVAGRPDGQGAARFRIDGALREVKRYSAKEYATVAEQLRAMACLDPDERVRPQDGRVLLKVEGRDYDLRLHVAPCVLGDSITVRVLDREAVPLDIQKCGHSQAILDALGKLTKAPHGLFVLCGPTGCGNTTTLYSLLKEIAARGVEKVTTAEDPVEFIIDGVEQMQIRPEAGVTFASAVRSMLRSDPDVIMVGEIRDREAAMVLHQAAMTGHLVFTTLHTNFAAEVPGRLIDIGVPPFVVGSCLIGAMAQRLVRRLRPQTRRPDPDAHEKLRVLRADEKWFAQTFYGPAGSAADPGHGYQGRVPINDLLLVDADVRKMITAKPTSQDLSRVMHDKGMVTLMEDGLAKAAAGLTSLDELLRTGLACDWFV